MIKDPKDATSLSAQFNSAMRLIYDQAVAECRYRPTYFLQMLFEYGGVQTAKRLLAKPHPSDGFTKLVVEFGRPDLTVESLILEPRWSPLFSEAELAKARLWLGNRR